ncbi:MAG: nucleotidyltransferase domain-containing protein [Methanomicrobiales archaeon]
MRNDRLLVEYLHLIVPKIVHQFSPVTILISGSRVKGTPTADSDIDVIIVADAFFGVPFVRRMVVVLKSARFKKHVDYFCYTPEEFEGLKTTSAILRDAVEGPREVFRMPDTPIR